MLYKGKEKRAMVNAPVTSRRSLVGSMLFVWILGMLVGHIAKAQQDQEVTSAEQAYRAAILTRVTAAARTAKVPLLPNAIAYAGDEGGFVVNTAVASVNNLPPAPFAAGGTDLLFVYIGASGRAVPIGYYKVRLVGHEAQFIAPSGKVAATLPATVQGPERRGCRAAVQDHGQARRGD
jgi:type II secretory pathway pseudopilin PulG